MAEIEKNSRFADAGIVVLPIVMNTAAPIQADLDAFGVSTPCLLDDRTVAQAYGALGKGMQAGRSGDGFVLVDADGVQRCQGNHLSMWLDPRRRSARGHLASVSVRRPLGSWSCAGSMKVPERMEQLLHKAL